jgi:hypothetical protein
LDEIKDYLDCRYVAAAEACWRLLSLKTHHSSHTVTRLQVHLPQQQQVYFSETDNLEQILESGDKTMLTEFFTLCARDSQARELLYHELPEHYSWSSTERKWKKRVRCRNVIGRMYTVSPRDQERFFLRLLLCRVRGPTSFDDLKTYRGQVYPTFKLAAIARGLVETDQEWEECLQEASVTAFPRQIRELFCSLLLFCNPENPRYLWDK